MGQSCSRHPPSPSPSPPDARDSSSPNTRLTRRVAAKRGALRMRPCAKTSRRIAAVGSVEDATHDAIKNALRRARPTLQRVTSEEEECPTTAPSSTDRSCEGPGPATGEGSAKEFTKKSIQHALPKMRWVTSDEEECPTTAPSSTDRSCEEPGPATASQSHDREECQPHAPSIIEYHHPVLSDSYRVLYHVVGVGVAGEVRRCVHLPTHDLRAVKTIAKHRVARPDRLRREVALLRAADHPHIVALHDAYEDADAVHLVTELCRGGELYERIAERARWGRGRRRLGVRAPACFREGEAARVLRGLLSAVAYLHARDVVHRDIKPENVLFDDDDDVKLVDFGLAVRHPPGRRPLRSVVGTAYYMAPEVLAGAYGRACDLWSVGVVAYTMLAGRPPFHGPTNDAIFAGIRDGRYRMEGCPRWEGASAPARDFVRGLLATDPARRGTAAAALEHPWLRDRAPWCAGSGATQDTGSCRSRIAGM